MKKLFFVLCAVSAGLFAGAQVQFGVKAGYNLANVTQSGSSTVDTKAKSDFSGGFLASIPLFSSCTLQPEVMYSGQGTSVNAVGETAKLNFDYINVPVLFKYQHTSGVFVETGPQIGFLISAKEKADGQSMDVKSSFQSTDFSWAFGLGYKIPHMGLGIDARYNLGLTNIAKNTGSDDETIKNSVFQFGLFYVLGGK
jgi:hypothetical protein